MSKKSGQYVEVLQLTRKDSHDERASLSLTLCHRKFVSLPRGDVDPIPHGSAMILVGRIRMWIGIGIGIRICMGSLAGR